MQTSLVTIPDLKDQPRSEFILITGGSVGKPQYHAVDTYRITDQVASFYRAVGQELRLIYMCRVEAGIWVLVHRSAVNIVTEEELCRFEHEDSIKTEEIMKEIDPKAWNRAKEYLSRQGLPVEMDDEKLSRPETGMYL